MKFGFSAVLAATLLAGQAGAATTTDLVFKLNDSAAYSAPKADAVTTWTGSGGLNEGLAGATDLTANGIDYKSSFVDTNWMDVLSVRVAVLLGGIEQAFIEFDAAGTSKNDFFSVTNVLSSTWSDLTSVPHNFFSIDGDPGIDRHWYVNSNYGGCEADVGHMVAIDTTGASPCGWENANRPAGDPDRLFLFANDTSQQNWTSGNVASGDVFAVFVTYETAAVPIPASGLLLLGALGAAGALRRRARR
jgi:hypothetical protein